MCKIRIRVLYIKITDDDQFKGSKFHTAIWQKDVELKDKKVAVIGTGASSVQTVPNIAQDVNKLYVFQRTAAWVPQRHDFEYSVIVSVSKYLIFYTQKLNFVIAKN